MSKEIKSEKSNTGFVIVETKLASKILKNPNIKIITYEEWHRNRDKVARESRNISIHKKKFC